MLGRVVPQYSQEYKVQEALHRVGVSHNSGVVADLVNVQVKADGVVYFCQSRLTVAAEVTVGDGGALPPQVRLEGNWEFPAPGYYHIRHAYIEVNGAISIRSEAETEFVPVLLDKEISA